MDTDKPPSYLGRSINTFPPEEEEELLPGTQRSSTRTAPLKCCILVLSIALVAAIIAILGLSIGVGVAKSSRSTSGDGTCLTDGCVQLAAAVLSRMDTSVDPCVDFYNFSCGRWEHDNIIPSGYPNYNDFVIRADLNSAAIKKILEGTADSGVEAVGKLRTLYQACMDTSTIENQGAGPMLNLISRTGGWSLLRGTQSSWNINGSGFILDKVLKSTAFFKLTSEVDDKNPRHHILMLEQSGLSLPAPELYNIPANGSSKAQAALKLLITTTLHLLNSSLSTDSLSQVADDIIALETKLAQIFVSEVQLRDPYLTYNLMSLSNLSQLCPSYNWPGNIATLLNITASLAVDGSELVVVATPTYFANLTSIISSANASVLENYAKWHLVLPRLEYLDSSFRSAYYTFSKVTSGSGEKDRYKFCIGVAQKVMPLALSLPYTNVLVPNETKPLITEMIENVKTAFKQRLDSNTWLDTTTKGRCKEKVDAILSMVAYPDSIYNTTYLNSQYRWLNVSGNVFFENMVSYSQHDVANNFRHLRKAVDKTIWQMAPTDVNAYYEAVSNEFVFLEGILNIPFFQAGWPMYYNYGTMGVIIGHELTHGFDDHGQMFNKDGLLQPWWTPKSQQNFNEKKLCFAKQYSAFEVFGFHINGNLTLGENIADNGGLVTSYQAYRNAMSSVAQQSLPGVQFTPDQLFFLGFGQTWCSLYTQAYIQKLVLSNPHSPGSYRVIGAVQNSEAFSKAFNCPANTNMNPSSKCELW